MSNRILFSIVVPIYRVEKYLPQCVDSLLTQDFEDYEIILVDDGSPDGCPLMCDKYASQNSNIKVIHKPNGGLSDARNKGIEIASGEYITFVDSDDFWKNTDVLSGVAQIINQYQPDVVVSDIIKYYSDGDKFVFPDKICDSVYNSKSKLEVLKYLYFNHADLKMSACQKFVRREYLVSCLFIKGLLSEDIDWSLSLFPVIKSICVYSEPYYCYRQTREGSITNTASQRSFDSLMQIIDKWSDKIPLQDIPQEEKDIYLGYLAYQLSIAMPLVLSLAKDSQKNAFAQIEHNIKLFRYQLNFKTKKVKFLIKCLGVKMAAYLLCKYIQRRHQYNNLDKSKINIKSYK